MVKNLPAKQEMWVQSLGQEDPPYRGFDVVVPTNMTMERQYVYLQRNGRYRVELGVSEKGIMTRLDNFLDNISGHLKKLHNGLEKINIRESEVKAELANKDGYSDIIQKIRELEM